MTDMSVQPTALDVFPLNAPLKTPRRNAFGTMHARPGLVLRITDASGHIGWGEVFCNWPAFGVLHRARILRELLAPMVIGRSFESPRTLWRDLTEATRLLVIQANEPGPFEQCIAGLDIAAWDMAARRADRPLYALIAPDTQNTVPVYASALTAETQAVLVPPLRDQGWSGFKLKVGFGLNRDIEAVSLLSESVGDWAIMLDANQAWSVEAAACHIEAFTGFAPLWIEEPIAATAAIEDWAALATSSAVPLAAGENLRGREAFEIAARDCGITYLQPDAIKWGGISGLIEVAELAHSTGRRFAPHYLGSGVGLLASAHIAQALGASWMEVDVTENPLRSEMCPLNCLVTEGYLDLDDAPGIGLERVDDMLSDFVLGSGA